MSGEGPPPPCWRHSSFLPRWSGWRRTPLGRSARRGCGPGRPRPIPMPCAARSPRWPSSPPPPSRTAPSGPSRCPTSALASSCWPCRAACSRARGSPSSRSGSPPPASSPAIWRGSPGTLRGPRRCASSRRPRRSRRGCGSRSIRRGTSWTAPRAIWPGRARRCAKPGSGSSPNSRRAPAGAMPAGAAPPPGATCRAGGSRVPSKRPPRAPAAAAPGWVPAVLGGPQTGGERGVHRGRGGLPAWGAERETPPPIAPHSTLPVFTTCFADIGDRQSIAQSLSTFSAHVAVLRDILARAGAGSLVLLDEIGSGTDPAEGAALAGAVLRTLTRRRAVTLATSHLCALKQLATETVGVVNASLQFDAEPLTPTYRLLKGVPGRSYGLAIARRLGVPADVLAEAERALPETERALDALLAAVEHRARDLETRAQSLAAAEQRVAEEREALAARERQLVDRERDGAARARSLDREARDQARAYLLEARKTVEQALAQARAAVDEATAKEARRLVEKAIEDTDREEAGGKAGDEAGEGGRGRGWMSLEDLRRKDESAAAPRRAPRPARPLRGGEQLTTSATEVSLRGLRADEAEAVLIKALDDAILADLPYLRIIHGKGTGALRQLVQDLP